jgi:alpha-beta hydrolase superfamily lysophospholipase
MKKQLIGLVFATACATAPSATPTLPPARVITATPGITVVTATPPPVSPLPAPTPSEPVTVSIPVDGVTLAASYYAPAISPQAGAGSAPGVMLLPMLGRPRADWDAFARELQLYGVAALTLDLRGQGDSGGPEDWARAPGDVRAAWEALIAQPAVDRQATAIIGASMGANLALLAGADNAAVVGVIALSPGLDYHGVRPAERLAALGARPVFLIASQDDAYSYDSVRQLAGLAAGAETYYFTNAGHGTDMLRDPALQPLLLDWLTRQLGVVKG